MEIKTKIDLTPNKIRLLGMHSVLNILNVLMYNLIRIENAYGNKDVITAGQQRILAVSNDLREHQNDQEFLLELSYFPEEVRTLLVKIKEILQSENQSLDVFQEIQQNISIILDITEIRIRELLARVEHPIAWGTLT